MATPDRFPRPEQDPQAAKEALMWGKYVLTPEEDKRIRKEAEARGEDPNAAVEREAANLRQATAKLRERQAEKALEETERGVADIAEKRRKAS